MLSIKCKFESLINEKIDYLPLIFLILRFNMRLGLIICLDSNKQVILGGGFFQYSYFTLAGPLGVTYKRTQTGCLI